MTLAARQTVHTLRVGVNSGARLLGNLTQLPGVLANLARHSLQSDGFDPDPQMLRDHLLIPLGDEVDYPSDASHLQPALDLAAARNWPELLQLLRAWEDTCAVTLALTDLTTTALDMVARQAAKEERKNPGYLADMTAAFIAEPDDHMMASLLAFVHIRLGWSWRGDGMAQDISSKAEQKFIDHFDRAERLLEPFDAILLNAPSVAAARYHLFAAHPDAEELIEDWFYDYVDLTPDSISAFYAHGFQMLPQWFGADEGALDRAGLHAVAATRDRLGAAAYPALWLAAYDGICTDGVLDHLDVGLFYEGLDDLLAHSGDPRRANSLTRQLYDIAFVQNPFDAVTTSADPDEATIARLRLGYTRFVRHHLKVLIPQMWASADEARWYAAQAYRAELEAGATIRFEEGDLVIDMPHRPGPS